MPTYREDELAHYGILRKSGRYPWGSGGDNTSAGAAKRSRDFLGMVRDLEEQGLSKAEIAQGLGLETTTRLRDAVMIANNARRLEDQHTAEKLRAKGWSATAIGKAFDPPKNESSVRQLLDPSVKERTMILNNTVERLRNEVDAGGWIDIGRGQEYYIPGGGISKERLRAAVAVLKDEGYKQIDVQVDQAGTGAGMKTQYKVLCPPGTEYKDVVTSTHLIRGLTTVTEDGGRTDFGILPPMSLDSSRVAVNYKEDGGHLNDGAIYVRPGVKDIELGGSQYAQVRIDVDGTHYLKGMAFYKNDLPPGVDIVFNTNKSKKDPAVLADPVHGAMKKQSEDKDNPFGANIRRQITEGPEGAKKVTSVMNILDEEGKWDTWSRTLSSQVLSKQSPKLAAQQLDKTYAQKKQDLDEILALTNPTVREKLLQAFSDSADSDAVHLSAAGLPRSSYHVILPFNSLKDTEVYAPNYKHGETVALIRYPHGGTFEIPVLTVNNRNPEAVAAIGKLAKDAVGINAKVAERLSGADFDGDFVMVVPNNNGGPIKSTPPLRKLEGFDPKSQYKPYDGMQTIDGGRWNEAKGEVEYGPKGPSPKGKGKQMGDVSNLITDMTIGGATHDEIARAVKHSMVVIDAEKHHLDYKRSAQENGIRALKEKYQGINPRTGQPNGASTLISRATAEQRVLARRPARAAEGGRIDKATGELVFKETGQMRTIKETLPDGTVRYRTEPVLQKSTKLAETRDARTLMSKDGGTLIEQVYADHSNRLKAIANYARKEMVNNTDAIPTSPSAKKVYKSEVDQLKADLRIALMNSPRERQAQVIANAIIQQKRDANPHMDDATLKKVKSQALAEARTRAGAKKVQVPISETQWAAIQAGAVSKKMLKEILDNTDIEKVKEYATPRPGRTLMTGQVALAKQMIANGATQSEVAARLGVSLTTLKEGLG